MSNLVSTWRAGTCWDLLGKRAELPVCDLLGGRHGVSVALHRAISQQAPNTMAKNIDGYRAEGCTKFQLKVGGDPDDEIARIHATLEILGHGEVLIADANTGWLMHEAARVCVSLCITMTIKDSWGGDIVTAAIAHLAHSRPERYRFSATDFNSYVTVQTATETPVRENGTMKASDEPGLGIVPDLGSLGTPRARHVTSTYTTPAALRFPTREPQSFLH